MPVNFIIFISINKKCFTVVKNKEKSLKLKSVKKNSPSKTFLSKLSDSFRLIKNNKFLFSLTVILTIIYVAVSVAIMAHYWVEASAHQEAVFGYIDSIPLDDPTKSPLGSDPLMVYKEIDAAKNALIMMGLFILLATFFIDGTAWLLVKFMRSKDEIFEFLKSYIAIFFLFMALFGSLIYFTFKIAFSDALSNSPNRIVNIIGWILLLILLYLYFIAMALVTNSKLKEIPLKLFKNSIKLFTSVPTYALSLFLIIFFGYFTVYFLEGNLFMLSLSIIMFFVSLAYSKVLFSSQFE